MRAQTEAAAQSADVALSAQSVHSHRAARQ
jgi:hypothetical protein